MNEEQDNAQALESVETAVAVADNAPTEGIELNKYTWKLRNCPNGKFDGRCLEGRVRNPYANDAELVCYGDDVESVIAGLVQLVANFEAAEAKRAAKRKPAAE